MIDDKFVFLQKHFGVSKAIYLQFQKLTTKRDIKANTIILEAGASASKIYFMTSGIARSYLITESGKVHNKTIYSGFGYMAPFSALVMNRPSELSYQALTDCCLYEFPYNKLKAICDKNIEVANLYNKVLEQYFVIYEKRELQLMALNATQRYIALRERIPNIDDLIPQYQIASYLNITSVQLSRIRKQLQEKTY